nr:FecR domain-containing protein [Novosphingobium panipatense]
MTREDKIRNEAAFWVDRMNRPVFDPADGAAFDRWMSSDADHREAFAAMAVAWEDGVPQLAEVEAQPFVAPETLRQQGLHGRDWVTAALSMAAVVVVAVGLGVVPRFLPHRYESGPGPGSAIALVDGSRIQLGGNSAVQVQYLPWRRSVELTRGEAAFDVTHDESRPFSVDAGAARVVVLGTAFHIDRLAGGAVGVQVSRGAVQVNVGARGDRLAAGQAARVSGNAIRRVAMQEEDRAWQSGWFVARNVPLSDVVEKLRRYSNKAIRLDDQAAADRLIIGRFKVSEPKTVLEAMKTSYGLHVVETDDHISISQ